MSATSSSIRTPPADAAMAAQEVPPTMPSQGTTANARAWIALIRAGVVVSAIRTLVPAAGSASAALDLPDARWRAAGASAEALARLREPGLVSARDLAWLDDPRHRLLGLDDADFPALLRRSPSPPPALFIEGDAGWLWHPQVAVVGSRNATAGGRDNTRDFATALAQSGLIISSGLAEGIDAAAHAAALAADCPTVAVVGTGSDVVYPASQRRLAERIRAHGAIVSEFAPGTPARRENFPRRNRIIAGLALGTLVIEAAERSGALITARQASDAGREVFAVPGSIHNPLARGCHALIREGAKLVESAQDILAELAPRLQALLSAPPAAPAQVSGTALPAGVAAPAALDEDYRKLLDLLADSPAPVDLLVRRSGLTAEIVSSMLLILELEGYVATAPGGLYSRLV